MRPDPPNQNFWDPEPIFWHMPSVRPLVMSGSALAFSGVRISQPSVPGADDPPVAQAMFRLLLPLYSGGKRLTRCPTYDCHLSGTTKFPSGIFRAFLQENFSLIFL